MMYIEIKTRNDLIYANVPVWSIIDNDYKEALVLIDTGATVTAFSDAALKSLGCYNEEKKASVRTASGFVDVYEVNIPKVQLGSFELINITVHAHTYLDDFHFDGIIGMNILNQFNFGVNFDTQIMTLEKRKI
ncbi:MAG: retroviral-like aspartic protease family protein [Oscillospiraceae bacterium]|nr:retroviral-like aspartic protease family protein [Oscillospiraceae bacterium]